MMVRYGIGGREASWPFYLACLAFLVAFVLIPGSLGAIAAILLATLLPRRRKTGLAVLVGGLTVGLIVVGLRVWRTPGEALTREWMDALVGRLAFSRHPL